MHATFSNEIDPALRNLFAQYIALNIQNYGQLASIVNAIIEYPLFGRRAIKYKLADAEFPIGAVFGDDDFMGSEGIDQIIRENKWFKTGESQLFKLQNAGHNMFFHNPSTLAQLMVDFFEGQIKSKFEIKPRLERHQRTNLI